MKTITLLIIISISFSCMAQDKIENWYNFYSKDIINQIQFEKKRGQCENINNKSSNLVYTEENYQSIENNYDLFFKDFNATKKLSNILDVLTFNEAIQFIDGLISKMDSKTDIAFTYEHNVFLSLYESEYDNPTNIKSINNLYNKYLYKCTDLYPVLWLNHFSLYCIFSENNKYEALYSYWIKNSINSFVINPVYLTYFKIGNISEKYNFILDNFSSDSQIIYLLFCLSSNEFLTSKDKGFLFTNIKKIDFKELYEDDYNMLHSTLKNLNNEYNLPDNAKYLLPVDWMISKLKKIISIKPTTSYIINTKFTGSYYYKTESILSWVFQLNGNLSAYYSVPEQMLVDKSFSDIFFNYFKLNYKTDYALITDKNEIKIKICEKENYMLF